MNYLSLDLSNWTPEEFRRPSSRDQWAERLGISEKTLQRYEREILYRDITTMPRDSEFRLAQAFYWRNRRDRNKLDYYQKFILVIIKMLSFGEAYPDQKLSYSEIQDWFSQTDQITNKKRILLVTPPLVKEMLDRV